MTVRKSFKLPTLIYEILMDALGSLLVSIGIYTFAAHADIAPGGVSGIALIVHYFFPSLPIGTVSLLLNIPLLFIALRFLSRRFLIRTFRSLVILAVFMDVVVPLFPYYQTTDANRAISSIIAGVFTGAGLAVVYGNASCTGGTDLLTMSMKKVKPHLSLGSITMIIDGIIILSGGLVYGNVDAVLYGFLFTYVSAVIMDKMMYGVVSGKMALIITRDSGPIAKEIDTQIARGSTILQAKGSYSGQNKEIILSAMSRQQLPALRKVLKATDPDALLIILEYNEVFGSGFQSLLDEQA